MTARSWRTRGFSLVELSLVITISFIAGSLIFPVGVSFLRSQILDDTTQSLVAQLRKAQIEALYDRHESAHGVKLLESSYVLFEGSSYVLRNTAEDLAFPMSDRIEHSGVNEFVFERRTGEPNASGVITLSAEGSQRIITINDAGKIEW